MFKEFPILYFLAGKGRNKFGLPLENCFKGEGAVSLLLLAIIANHDSVSAELSFMSSFLTSNLE